MEMAVSTKIDSIFFFDCQKWDTMNVCLFFWSLSPYILQMGSKVTIGSAYVRGFVQICSAQLFQTYQNIFARSHVLLSSLCRAKNATQSTDGSKIKTANPHVSFACLDSNTPI
jgi:hypothetical protein